MATNPTLLTMPIAENGQKNTIPATQETAGDGLLSQSTGFPPETSLPLGAGGVAPSREDFNGAFNLLSDIAFYAQKGWTFEYDAAQDYYKGCVVIDPSDGNRYECVSDMTAGTVAPHADSAGDYWKEFTLGGGKSIGEIFAYGGDTNPEGALLCNGAAVSRTMYADLFDIVGTKYGSGDGTTTFNLPNYTDAIIPKTVTKTAYETAGSATFTATKSGLYKITVKGAGGGGAGGRKSTSNYYGGGAGGEGGTTIGYEHLTAGDIASVVIGAGGAGGAASAAGSNGGDSAVTVNLSTYTGGGGGGAAGTVFSGAGGTGTIPGAPGGAAIFGYNAGMKGATGGGNGGGVPDSGSLSGGNGSQGGGGSGGNSSAETSPYQGAGGNGGDGYVWIEFLGDAEAYYIQAFNASTDPALVDLTQILQDLANRLTREQTPAFNHRDVITTSGTYTAPVTGWYKITVKGGGGGGQGGTATSSTYRGGGGGGEGGTTIGFEHLTAGDTATVVIGAGGTGGAAGGTAGSNGGNSTVTVNNNTYNGDGGDGAGTAGDAGGGIGGDGTIPGASGCPQPSTTNSGYSYGAIGGGNGGANCDSSTSAPSTAKNGGGGAGGFAYGATTPRSQYAGGAGGDGYAEFAYFVMS